MTATTVNQSYVADAALFRAVKRQVNLFKSPNSDPDGGTFHVKHTSSSIATTSLDEADDEVFFFTYPKGAKLLDLLIDFGDYDSGSDLVIDVIVEDSAGTEVVLINDSVAGKTGAVDELDAGLRYTDVGGMKLGFKIVTPAATAVAGTAVIYTSFTIGDFITL